MVKVRCARGGPGVGSKEGRIGVSVGSRCKVMVVVGSGLMVMGGRSVVNLGWVVGGVAGTALAIGGRRGGASG